MKSYTVKSIQDFKESFQELNDRLNSTNIVLLTGSLGAGKTTYVREYLKFRYELSDQDLSKLGVTSPTFAIQNQYEIKSDTVLHFDFYRINESEYDFEDHYEELAHSKIVFIEWPEKINLHEMFEKSILVEISIMSDSTRKVLLDS